MAARLALARLAPAARASFRRGAVRHMSSAAHDAPPKGDLPWIIGSAAVFGPVFAYLITRKPAAHAHAEDKHEAKHEPEPAATNAAPIKDDEGTEASAADVAASINQSVEADDPKNAQAAEATEAAEAAGETAPAAATDDTLTSHADKFTRGAAALQAQEVSGSLPEPTSEPDTPKSGTFQDEGDEGPTNMGDARAAATEGTTPKEKEEES